MRATESILKTWRKFNDFPMETLTKAWYFGLGTEKKQRDVPLMREHREQYGMSGNCFDLAIWLLDELKKDSVEAYPIGHGLDTEDAHVAVMAVNEKGQRYLCDLGDQWIAPILIDTDSEDFSSERLSGFFPGAEVQVRDHEMGIEVVYYRPNGKASKQTYHTEPIEMEIFLKAAELCQNMIHPNPLVEVRVPFKSEIAHWEFYNWESFLSTSEGLKTEAKLEKVEEWAERIHLRTGYNKEILQEVLWKYKRKTF